MPCTLGDLIMGMTLFYSAADLGLQWNRYMLCSKPLNYWLLGSYATVATFRGLQHFICDNLEDLDNDEFLYALTGPDRLPLKVLQYGCVFPFFIFHTFLGTIWMNDIIEHTPYCLPDETQPWFVLLWMTFCYLFIVLQGLFVVAGIMMRWRVRQLHRSLRQIETEELRDRWGFSRFDTFSYGLHPFYRYGMPPEEIIQIPSFVIENGPPDEMCSICLERFEMGDTIRVLPNCKHKFHQACSDLWLLRRAICPNCKTSLSMRNGHPDNEPSDVPDDPWTFWGLGHTSEISTMSEILPREPSSYDRDSAPLTQVVAAASSSESF